MHPRIEALAIEAAGKGYDTFATSDFDSQAKVEKFAQLILQDCLHQIDKLVESFDKDGEDQQALGATWAIMAIARHFGLE